MFIFLSVGILFQIGVMQVLTKFFLEIVKIYDVLHILTYYISISLSFLMIRLNTYLPISFECI
jgi:hypothetical protein